MCFALTAKALATSTHSPVALLAQVPPTTVYWLPGAKAGQEPKRPAERARKIRIQYAVGGCVEGESTVTPTEELDHIAVRRRARHVTITVYTRPVERSGPYSDLCLGVGILKTATVSLRGRLGRRAIRDGHFSPPRVMWQARH